MIKDSLDHKSNTNIYNTLLFLYIKTTYAQKNVPCIGYSIFNGPQQ